MRFLRFIAVLSALAALAAPVFAQTPSGEISGTVVDSSGSVLPGVRVTLTNAATNAVRLTQSNESGVYVFPAVPPGTYTLKVELEGFSTAEQTNINFAVVPGYDYGLRVTPTAAGDFRIICNEFCGIGHHTMVGRVIVVDSAGRAVADNNGAHIKQAGAP